jgi:hypothetical protein
MYVQYISFGIWQIDADPICNTGSHTVSAKVVKLSFSFWMQIREINCKRPDFSFVGFACHAVSDAGAASLWM